MKIYGKKRSRTRGSANVFSDLGFTGAEAEELLAKSVLIEAIESVTLDRLTAWLTALGRSVEIHVRPYDARAKTGQLVAAW